MMHDVWERNFCKRIDLEEINMHQIDFFEIDWSPETVNLFLIDEYFETGHFSESDYYHKAD